MKKNITNITAASLTLGIILSTLIPTYAEAGVLKRIFGKKVVVPVIKAKKSLLKRCAQAITAGVKTGASYAETGIKKGVKCSAKRALGAGKYCAKTTGSAISSLCSNFAKGFKGTCKVGAASAGACVAASPILVPALLVVLFLLNQRGHFPFGGHQGSRKHPQRRRKKAAHNQNNRELSHLFEEDEENIINPLEDDNQQSKQNERSWLPL